MKLSKTGLLKKTPTFINDFDNIEDVLGNFRYKGMSNYSRHDNPIVVPKTLKILFADYTYEDYSGDAYVLGFDKERDQFFEVHGSHCSCYGLEDQWDAEYFTDVKQLEATLVKRFDGKSGCYRSASSSNEFKSWLEEK